MNKYWSRLARGLVPYTPGEQPRERKYIKLNTNENPYGPSPGVTAALKLAVDDSLRLYPDPTGDMLLTAAAESFGVKKEQVFAGNGSDEVLAFAFMALFDPGKAIVFPDITYSFYPVYAALCGLDFINVSLDDDFNIPVEQLTGSPGGVIVANPNAPTGKALSLGEVRRIIEGNPENAVIIDEAYIDYGGQSAVKLVDDYPNLLVVHTFSKSRSLAGMRIGIAFGDAGLIEAVNNVKNSFNSYTMDRLALIAGTEALKDAPYYKEITGRIIASRERFVRELTERDFLVVESAANFVFARHNKVPAAEIFRELRERGILVRYFNKPSIDNHLRISIGTDEDMDMVIEALDDILTTAHSGAEMEGA